jgi:serine/threonine protein kinase
LLKPIGRGAFAEVYRAERRGDPQDAVAFKRPREHVPLARDRMAREIHLQQQLDHPNVMPILDSAADRSWFVMPLALGSLQDLWTDGEIGEDAHEVAVAVVRDISSGLEHAHVRGLVHRDVSPMNILALEDSPGQHRWVIGDWGTVRRPRGKTTRRLTDPGEGLGTQGFAAPETWEDAHEVDLRADVYSLGRVVAWLLTGRRPVPNRPLLPAGPLRGFVQECTALDPTGRFDSMKMLRERLDELLAEPAASPRRQVQDFVDRAVTEGDATERQALAIANLYPDNSEVWLDELARMPLDHVRRLAHDAPDLAASAAQTMMSLLDPDPWGHRDFDYLNVPLRWTFEVLGVLVADGVLDLAEDVAVPFFERDALWDRRRQKPITVAWLRSLTEPQGAVMARAVRRSRAHDYYKSSLASGHIVSRSLALEFGR